MPADKAYIRFEEQLMKGTEKKFKKQMDRGQLASLLRQLADELEGKRHDTPAPLNGAFDQFQKASLKFKKNKRNRLSVKVKVESPLPRVQAATGDKNEGQALADIKAAVSQAPAPTTAFQDDQRPKYKALKKRMKSSFKHIREALAGSRMPAAEAVTSFLADSQLMTRYPGYGDEYYDAYRQLCARFETAYSVKDLDALKGLTEDLSRMKSECHDRYK
jgi:XXXCH domain-containing protein